MKNLIMYKLFSVCLLALTFSLSAMSQKVYIFKMFASSGGDYTVTVNTSEKTVSAKSNGNMVFAYSYKDYNSETNLIGFSFDSQTSVLMRPDHSKHYFLIRSDAIFCSTSGASQEYYLEPVNELEYAVEFQSLFSELSIPKEPNAFVLTSSLVSQNTETFTVKGVSFNMVRVPGGKFSMGSENGESDERPHHIVSISSFMIGQTEVTQELWETVMGTNPSHFKGDKRPVESVSWNDCQIFISKLNHMTGCIFRLPTEAEWEYAAKGGVNDVGLYSGSDAIASVAWYDGNSGKQTHDVATKAPNRLDIYDMSGNVWEWCHDFFGKYKKSSIIDPLVINPAGPEKGTKRIYRGGSWYGSASSCRNSCRNSFAPTYISSYLGFRLAL